MAIALQSTAARTMLVSEGTGGNKTITSFVVDSGSDRMLRVRFSGEGDGTATQCEITAVTRDGQSGSRIDRRERTDWSWVETWKIVAPNVGTADLTFTMSEADNLFAEANVLQGVDQTTHHRTANGATGNSGTATVTVSGVQTDDYVEDVVAVDGGGKTLTVGANQTQDYVDSGSSGFDGGGSHQAGADGGVMSWTFTSAPWSITAVAWIPASGGSAQNVNPTGIASAEAFGTPRTDHFTNPTGIASAEAFGTPTINQEVVTTGIPSQEAFGTARTDLFVNPVGIPSEEAFGSTISMDQSVFPSGIGSGEVFGTPTIDGGVQEESGQTRMLMTGVGR